MRLVFKKWIDNQWPQVERYQLNHFTSNTIALQRVSAVRSACLSTAETPTLAHLGYINIETTCGAPKM
jgi:hypothetical protein